MVFLINFGCLRGGPLLPIYVYRRYDFNFAFLVCIFGGVKEKAEVSADYENGLTILNERAMGSEYANQASVLDHIMQVPILCFAPLYAECE